MYTHTQTHRNGLKKTITEFLPEHYKTLENHALLYYSPFLLNAKYIEKNREKTMNKTGEKGVREVDEDSVE